MPGFIVRHAKLFILLALFLVMFWLVTFQVKAGRLTFMEGPVLAISGFFERVFTAPFRFVGSAANHYVFRVRTSRENDRLKQELDRLRLENSITNELLIENERLREVLGFAKLRPLSSVMAQVIAKDSSPSSRTMIVDHGTTHGIEKDMAVITAAGVVGKVQTSLPGTAKVLLLTDPGSTLAVRVQRNREEGLLEGKLDRCALKYVSYYADIQEGDLLVTSGLDGIYPKGLPVATVVKVSKHEATAFQTVIAKPAVGLSRLEEVLVLTK
ncbi:MAG: rod shape-determining protein MreC [Nitrospirae bacterium GWC2_57_9]|nr:MAG: rod shape-determining protein MreC [Nitrospirae bacterium GWC2_57_9]